MSLLILIIASQLIYQLVTYITIEYITEKIDLEQFSMNLQRLDSYLQNYYIQTGIVQIIPYIPVINALSALNILADFKKNPDFYLEDFAKLEIISSKKEEIRIIIRQIESIMSEEDELSMHDLIFYRKNLLHIKKTYLNAATKSQIDNFEAKIINKEAEYREKIKIKKLHK